MIFSKQNFCFNKNSQKKEILEKLFSEDESEIVFKFKDFNLYSKGKAKQILKNINFDIKKNTVIGIIGPSGSGKSSLLRSINKIDIGEKNLEWLGKILYKEINILEKNVPDEIIKTQIGIVFQKPVMFPMSIKENILFGLRNCGVNDQKYLDEKLETLLRNCSLWDELKHRVDENPENTLSIGQQQRLCIARAIALSPKILLMDEPTSALDPKSNNKIEELIIKIAKSTTIILVSHSLNQIKRVTDYTLFLKDGKIVEYGETRKIFTNPEQDETRDFVLGNY